MGNTICPGHLQSCLPGWGVGESVLPVLGVGTAALPCVGAGAKDSSTPTQRKSFNYLTISRVESNVRHIPKHNPASTSAPVTTLEDDWTSNLNISSTTCADAARSRFSDAEFQELNCGAVELFRIANRTGNTENDYVANKTGYGKHSDVANRTGNTANGYAANKTGYGKHGDVANRTDNTENGYAANKTGNGENHDAAHKTGENGDTNTNTNNGDYGNTTVITGSDVNEHTIPRKTNDKYTLFLETMNFVLKNCRGASKLTPDGKAYISLCSDLSDLQRDAEDDVICSAIERKFKKAYLDC
ncbi:hypothetical protein Btru_037965 [Bulinus truncatus]|nr:hypothetical protein Btru_037965 [Bulinus truncatus]